MYRFQREDDMTIYSLMEESNTSSTKPKQASNHVAGFTGVNKLSREPDKLFCRSMSGQPSFGYNMQRSPSRKQDSK